MNDSIKRSVRPVVAITGASAGIGRAAALAFAKRGYAVGLIARGRHRLDATAVDVRAAGGEALVLEADVADSDAISAASQSILDEWGVIDVWVNNAMVTVYAPVDRLSAAEIRRVTDVTYLGQVHGTLAALRHMRARNGGTIVQIGSALSYPSIPLQSAYCAAKFAVRGFTDSVRTELAHERSAVRLTMVQLPAVNTPQFDWARSHLPRRLQPVGTIYSPEAVAEQIVGAAIDAPRELWVGRSSIAAILGTMVAPGWLDRLMARDAWRGQMTGDSALPVADNLLDTPPGNPGSSGRFGDCETRSPVVLSGTEARVLLSPGAFVSVVGLITAAFNLSGACASSRRRPIQTKRTSRLS